MTDDKRQKLLDCLINLSLRSGFDSFEKFRLYKEIMCSDKYKAVYPETQIISNSDDKVYVDNMKVMTAQNLYNPKDGSMVKFADKTSVSLGVKEPPIEWWASEKFDGIRAVWDGEKMVSRGSASAGGKPKVYTYIPEWFKKTLPAGIALDGEIWIGRGLFQKTSRLSTLKPGKSYTKEQIDNIWLGKEDPPVVFKVFDIPNDPRPFEKRMKLLQTVVKDAKECWKKIDYPGKKTFPIQFTEQIKIKSMEQLISLYRELTSEGAEGIMLRAPGSPYETKRSKYLLKYKIKEDAECIVRDYTLGEGRLTGMLGSLKCELLNNGVSSGVFTQIGTGFTDSQRTNYNKENSSEYIPLGSVVSFSYMEMTDDGIPRHPVYRGIREDYFVKDQGSSSNQGSSSEDFKNSIIEALKIHVRNEELTKSANWTYKVRPYKQAIALFSATSDKISNVIDALRILRAGGAKFPNEEAYFNKNKEYKSSTLQKIHQVIKTGVIPKLIEPPKDPKQDAIEELTKVAGIGPSTAVKLYNKGIKNTEDLKRAYDADSSIINLKQAIGLRHIDDLKKRIPRNEMNQWNEILNEIWEKTVNKLNIEGTLQLSGSYRRQAPDSGDIDALITTDNYSPTIMNTFYNNLVKEGIIQKENTIAKGPTKIMVIAKIDEFYQHLDIFYYTKDVYPFALLFTTGSKEFNVKMRADAKFKGFSLNERNLTIGSPLGREVKKEEYNDKIQKDFPETEEDIFKFLDYPYVLPQNR